MKIVGTSPNRSWRMWHPCIAAALSLLFIAAGPATTVKIMPLGDSITQGVSREACYRYYLDSLLHRASYPFDFVGTLSHWGAGFDADHEGHWGWEADRILPEVGGWARLTKPDIVLMHLGTNDILHENPQTDMVVVNRTIKELGQIIDTLRSVNNSITIFLARLIPDNVAWDRPFLDSLNRRIPTLAAIKSTTTSPVIVVDQNTGFNYATDLADTYHPNAPGAKKMAAKWFAALDTYWKSTTDAVSAPGRPAAHQPSTACVKSLSFDGGGNDRTFDGASGAAVFNCAGRYNRIGAHGVRILVPAWGFER